MGSSDKNDHLIANRVARLGDGKATQPKDIRLMGGYGLFAAAALGGLNFYASTNGQLYPKALVITPAIFLLGTWWLVDAAALAAGTRRNQQAILWACIGLGCVVGFAIVRALTGSFF